MSHAIINEARRLFLHCLALLSQESKIEMKPGDEMCVSFFFLIVAYIGGGKAVVR